MNTNLKITILKFKRIIKLKPKIVKGSGEVEGSEVSGPSKPEEAKEGSEMNIKYSDARHTLYMEVFMTQELVSDHEAMDDVEFLENVSKT